MYSRLAYVALKLETTENTPLKPTVFFGVTKADILTKFGVVGSTPILGDRNLLINPVKAQVDAPAGDLIIQIEPKNLGHFLKAVFGVVSTGIFFPISAASGAFTVGETITGGSSAKTATVVAVSNELDYLLVSGPSGAFTTGETITGGTSAKTATLGVAANTVYGHEFKAPYNTLPTYTLEIGYQNEAVRYTGLKFSAFKSIADKNNILEADVSVIARAAFINARVTAVASSSASPVTISVDQTQGLINADTIKVFRPSTGAFLDLNGVGIKTQTLTSFVAETSITIPSLTTTLAVGDLIVLAPQTPTYSQARELAWIGSSVAKIADTITSALTASASSVETFDLAIINETEERHAANAANLNGRFPTLIGLKAWKGTGKIKKAYVDQTFIDRLRNSSQTALQILTLGDLIGATTINYRFDIRCPFLVFQPYTTLIQNDALVDEDVPFNFFKSTADGYSVKAILVTDTATF